MRETSSRSIKSRARFPVLHQSTLNEGIILDDPFYRMDPEHLIRVRELLTSFLDRHQLILLSRDPRYGAWGHTISIARTHFDKEESPTQDEEIVEFEDIVKFYLKKRFLFLMKNQLKLNLQKKKKKIINISLILYESILMKLVNMNCLLLKKKKFIQMN